MCDVRRRVWARALFNPLRKCEIQSTDKRVSCSMPDVDTAEENVLLSSSSLRKDNNRRLSPSRCPPPCGPYFVHINGRVRHDGSRVPLTLYVRRRKKFSCHIRMINGKLSPPSFFVVYLIFLYTCSIRHRRKKLGYFKAISSGHIRSLLARLCCHS